MFAPFVRIVRNIALNVPTPSIYGKRMVSNSFKSSISTGAKSFPVQPVKPLCHRPYTFTPPQYLKQPPTSHRAWSRKHSTLPSPPTWLSQRTWQFPSVKTNFPGILAQLALRKTSYQIGTVSFLATGFWSKASAEHVAPSNDQSTKSDAHKISSSRVDVYSLQFYRDIDESHTFARGSYPYHAKLSDLSARLTGVDVIDQFLELSELLQNDIEVFQSQRDHLLESYLQFVDQYQINSAYLQVLSLFLEEFKAKESLDQRDLEFVLNLSKPITDNCSENFQDLLRILTEAVSGYNLLAEHFNTTTDEIDKITQEIIENDPTSTKNPDGTSTPSSIFSINPSQHPELERLTKAQEECVDHLRKFHLHFQNSARAVLDRGSFRTNILSQRYIPTFKSLKMQMQSNPAVHKWVRGIDHIFRDLGLHDINRPRTDADGNDIPPDEREAWVNGLNEKFSDAIDALSQGLLPIKPDNIKRERLIDIINNGAVDIGNDDNSSILRDEDLPDQPSSDESLDMTNQENRKVALNRRMLPLEELNPSKVVPEFSDIDQLLNQYKITGRSNSKDAEMIKLQITRLPLEDVEKALAEVHKDLFIAISVFNEYLKHNLKVIAKYNDVVEFHQFCQCYIARSKDSPATIRYSKPNRELLDRLPPYSSYSPLVNELEITLRKTQISLQEQSQFFVRVHQALDDHRKLLDGLLNQIAIVHEAQSTLGKTSSGSTRLMMLEDRTKQSVMSSLIQISEYTRGYSMQTLSALYDTFSRYYQHINPNLDVTVDAIKETYGPIYQEAQQIVDKFKLKYHLLPSSDIGDGENIREKDIEKLFKPANDIISSFRKKSKLSRQERSVRKAIRTAKKARTPAQHEQFLRTQVFKMKQRINRMTPEQKYKFYKQVNVEKSAEVQDRIEQIRQDRLAERLLELDDTARLAELALIADKFEEKFQKMSPAEQVEFQKRTLVTILQDIQGLDYEDRTALLTRYPDLMGTLLLYLPDDILNDMVESLDEELRLRKKYIRVKLSRTQEELDEELLEFQDSLDEEELESVTSFDALSELERARNSLRAQVSERQVFDLESTAFAEFLENTSDVSKLDDAEREKIIESIQDKIPELQFSMKDMSPSERKKHHQDVLTELQMKHALRTANRNDNRNYNLQIKHIY